MSENSKSEVRAQMASVCAMVAALECDYDRLAELREERDAHNAEGPEAGNEWNCECPDEAAELAELEQAAGDCEDEDAARQAILNDALSLEVRSGWETAGATLEPSEFRIVLCTGGPHVEIRGELDQHNEPESAQLYHFDWFEGGQEYIGNADEQAALLTYARQFYFGG